MPTHRREFLQALGAAAGAVAVSPSAIGSESIAKIGEAAPALGDQAPEDAATNEGFWSVVREAYDPPERPVNLMTVWYGAVPTAVRRAVVDFWEKTNDVDYHMRAKSSFWDVAVESARPRDPAKEQCWRGIIRRQEGSGLSVRWGREGGGDPAKELAPLGWGSPHS
jgi:hypothetical protein